MIGSPSPGIRGKPAIACARIPRPRTIHKWVPSGTNKVWLPYAAVTRRVKECPVIIEVAYSRAIGQTIMVLIEIGIVVFALLFVPGIKRRIFELCGFVLIVAGKIKSHGLI